MDTVEDLRLTALTSVIVFQMVLMRNAGKQRSFWDLCLSSWRTDSEIVVLSEDGWLLPVLSLLVVKVQQKIGFREWQAQSGRWNKERNHGSGRCLTSDLLLIFSSYFHSSGSSPPHFSPSCCRTFQHFSSSHCLLWQQWQLSLHSWTEWKNGGCSVVSN